MNEKHPIDELYHRTLHDAEVQPPPAVWEGIVRARRSRRRAWWPWALAAIVVIGAGGAWWLSRDQDHTFPSLVTHPRPRSHSTPAATLRMEEGPGRGPDAQQGPVMAGTGDQGRAAVSNPAQDHADAAEAQGSGLQLHARPDQPASNGARMNEAPTIASGMTTVSMAGNAAVASEPTSGTKAAATGMIGTVTPSRLSLRPSPTMLAGIPSSTLRTAQQAPYVLPKVERWVALELGTHDVARTWQGSDNTLVDALNAIEAPHPTLGGGGLFGWQWRSGLGLSVGAAYEGSRYEFNHIESALNVDSIVQESYLVTLDTQVFVNSTSTTVYGTSEEARVSGSNSLGILLLPVEAYWHTPVQRWTFGVRVGVQGEVTVVRRGYTLVNTVDEGPRSAPINDEAFDARFVPVISGTLAADVGYLLTERWGLWLSPGYMRGITALGTTDQPWSLPERFSLRMRLSYSFSRRP